MPRLLSKVSGKKLNAKDDFSVQYHKGKKNMSIYEIENIFNEDFYREDDWNFIYNDPDSMFYLEDIPFLWDEVVSGIPFIQYCFNKEMPNKKSKTVFGNSDSEVEFVSRVLREFGLPDEKKMEIDRIISRVKTDMQQDAMNKEFAENMK